MKKFPIIELKVEEALKSQANIVVGGETPKAEEPTTKQPPKEENIFVKKEKETKLVKEGKVRSAKQLAHLETIRAKALIARQNKSKAKKTLELPPDPVAPPETPSVIVEQPQAPPVLKQELYTKTQMDEYAKGALVNYHTQERDKRITEVRKKQVELEEQRKKYDVSSLLKKNGRGNFW